MEVIDRVTPVYPGWKVTPTGDKKDKKQDKEQETNQEKKDSSENSSDDGRPHIDEFA